MTDAQDDPHEKKLADAPDLIALRLRQLAETIVDDIQAHRDNEQTDETIVRHVQWLVAKLVGSDAGRPVSPPPDKEPER